MGQLETNKNILFICMFLHLSYTYVALRDYLWIIFINIVFKIKKDADKSKDVQNFVYKNMQ